MEEENFGEDADFSAFLQPAQSNTTPKPAQPPVTVTGKKVASEPRPSKVEQPKPQALPSRAAPSAVLVSARQKGNPILNHIRLLPWEYADIPSDYVIGNTTCALFLSLKYHRLHPEYIYTRIKSLGAKYNLRILLTMVDISNHEDCLKELSKTSLVNNMTLILCWSAAEAAHYLELYKSSENAQPNAIRAQQAQSYEESLVEFVTAPRSVNKSDAASLISTFGSLQNAVNAQPEQINLVPGWGEKKVQQWCGAVREDFRIRKAPRRGVGQGRGGRDDRTDRSRNTSSGNVALDTISNSVQQHTAEEIGEDEEEALLLAERTIPHDSHHTAKKSKPSQENASAQESLSEGVMEALAKLREGGG